MRNILITFILTIFATSQAMCQEIYTPPESPMRRWYSEETIFMVSPNSYMKNGQVYKGHKNLVREFSISPGAMYLYRKSRLNRTLGTVLSIVGAAGSIYSLVKPDSNVRTFFWISLGTGAIGGTLNIFAQSQINAAVWERNRDALIFLDQEQRTK